MRKTLINLLCSLALLGCASATNKQDIIRNRISAPRTFSLEEAIGVNEALANFLDEIPGAEKIERYLTPGAKHCLIHIRQVHLTEFPLDTPKKELKEVRNVQDNIYRTLSYLIENFQIEKVYVEGLTPDLAPLINLCAKISYIHANPDKIDTSDIDKWIPPAIEDSINIEKKEEALYSAFLMFQTGSKYDAVYRLASEKGSLEILAAEDMSIIREAEKAFDRLHGLGAIKWVTDKKRSYNAIFEDREDNILKVSSAQDSPLVVVTYGADHAWGGKASCGKGYRRLKWNICDNIAKWNFEHPNKKFSLIEIAPFGL